MSWIVYRVTVHVLGGLLLVVVLGACGSGGDKRAEEAYLQSKSAPDLNVPADLLRPVLQRTYEIPEVSAEVLSRAPVAPEELAKPPVFIDIGKEQDELDSEGDAVSAPIVRPAVESESNTQND